MNDFSELLIEAAKGAVTIAIGGVPKPSVLRVWRPIYKRIAFRWQLKRLHGELFGAEGVIATKAGAAHPGYGDELHPDDKIAAEQLQSLYRHTGDAKLEDEPWLEPPVDHVFLLGDPQSNAISRLVLCYEQTEGVFQIEKSPLFKPRWSSILYPYNYPGLKTPPQQMIKRFVDGVLQEGPVYELYDHETGDRYCSNDRQPGDWLNVDYLLVTRVLNTYSIDTVEQGKIATVFGGLHGAGTRAVGLLLGNVELLQTTNNMRESSLFYQALYRVYVENDRRNRVTRPARIELVKDKRGTDCVTPLDLDLRSIWQRVNSRSGAVPGCNT